MMMYPTIATAPLRTIQRPRRLVLCESVATPRIAANARA